MEVGVGVKPGAGHKSPRSRKNKEGTRAQAPGKGKERSRRQATPRGWSGSDFFGRMIRLQVLMLSWEYPPRNVGGLGRHVEGLAEALVSQGVQVEVVTCGVSGASSRDTVRGVRINRVESYPVNAPDFVTWVLQLNFGMVEQAAKIINQRRPTLIHAHDWLVAFAGGTLKHLYRLPLVATIHATEAGRNHGLYTDTQRYINSVEWWLTYEAWRVIVCSQHMKHEVQGLFQLPTDKIEVIANGVDGEKLKGPDPDPRWRQWYARPEERIVFFVGRLVQEKGAHLLIEALPRILAACPQAKLVIAGQGPAEAHLKNRAWALGVAHKVYFAGYVDDATRNALYKTAEVAVFPSLYEPFGIVALEAMATGTPVVASDTGGLREIITPGVDGLLFPSGHVVSLADNVIRVLSDSDLAARLRQSGRDLVQKVYDWKQVAQKTAQLYQRVEQEYRQSPWRPRLAYWPGFASRSTSSRLGKGLAGKGTNMATRLTRPANPTNLAQGAAAAQKGAHWGAISSSLASRGASSAEDLGPLPAAAAETPGSPAHWASRYSLVEKRAENINYQRGGENW